MGRLIDKMPWWANDFKPAGKSEKRVERKRREQQNGERCFTVHELRAILNNFKGMPRAWVLLALNCGMYSRDIGRLRWQDIKQSGKSWVIDTSRVKTSSSQVAPLWSETIDSLQAFSTGKPNDYIFTTPAGAPYFKEECVVDDAGRFLKLRRHDAIARQFLRLIEPLGIKRAGVNFGAFRHTHVSATAIHPDINARRVVRGHRIEGIEEHYDFADLPRLKAVTDVARRRLYLDVLKNKKARTAKSGA